ncbi:flagellin [Anaerobiospirillum succiniciproducens]|uniref:flagellin n=1 Tax=Anaerobiospirillum succiniciproducens TaxID=13335 RepID=UPI00042657BF|nr:flagellin [Anaerobiospirillum succiniciproducens]
MITLAISEGFHMSGIATMAGIELNKKAVGLSSNNGVTRWLVHQATLAQATLGNIDRMIEIVDSKRAALGAIQNRMESTIRNQSSISENESDARSRIRDTDFASETASLTQNQIIQQASQTILSQANQRPTVALSLLGGR